MLHKTLVILLIILAIIVLSGCKKSPSPTAQQETQKTAAEYKAEAKKEITKDNKAGELDKIEKEMQEEAAREGLP